MSGNIRAVAAAPLIQTASLTTILALTTKPTYSGMACLCLAGIGLAIVCLALYASRIQSTSASSEILQLAEVAYWKARRHANQGCNLLVPNAGDDPETVHLRMQTKGDRIFINQVRWNGSTPTVCKTIRQYELGPNGQVIRRVIGCTMTKLDERWCLAPLSLDHLTYLVDAFEHTHVPIRAAVR